MQNTDSILQTPPSATGTVFGGSADDAAADHSTDRDAPVDRGPSAEDPSSTGPNPHAPGEDGGSAQGSAAADTTFGDAAGTPVDQREGCHAATGEGLDSEWPGEQPGDAPAACGAGNAPTGGSHNADLGLRGETAAVRFLKRRGMIILERNWTCKWGEADIIACDDEAIHFVEVKTRSNVNCGFPSEAVDRAKRNRYERIAISYLSQCDIVDAAVMFDIISIVVTGPNRALLRFHRNAFCGCE